MKTEIDMKVEMDMMVKRCRGGDGGGGDERGKDLPHIYYESLVHVVMEVGEPKIRLVRSHWQTANPERMDGVSCRTRQTSQFKDRRAQRVNNSPSFSILF